MGKELEIVTNIWERLSQTLETSMKLKGDFFENDYVELAGDTFKLFGFAKKASALISQKKFENFLKGFNPRQIPTEEQLKKLEKYVTNEQRADFIADSISKILLSKSTKTCILMGTLLNSIIEKDNDVSYEEMICLNALLNFYDVDLDNYKLISQFINNNVRTPRGTVSLEGRIFNDFIKESNLNKASVRLTIEKCVSIQILSQEFDLDSDFDDDYISNSNVDLDEYHKVTLPGKMLYELIDKLSNNP